MHTYNSQILRGFQHFHGATKVKMDQVAKSKRKFRIEGSVPIQREGEVGTRDSDRALQPSNRGIWVEEQPQYLREAYPVPAQAKWYQPATLSEKNETPFAPLHEVPNP